MRDTFTDPNTRVVYPPFGTQDNNSTGILSVILHDNEEVEWTYYQGKVVGYTIMNKPVMAHNNVLQPT
jgi:hypothetical protein